MVDFIWAVPGKVPTFLMSGDFYSIGKFGRSELVATASDWLIVHYYSELWKVMACGDSHIWTAFPIDGMRLMATHQVLGNLLLLKSRETMKIFDEAIIMAQNDLLSRLEQETISVKTRLLIRWHRLPNFSETYRSKIPKSIDANKLLMVRGTIVRAENPKLIEWEVTYQCQICHGTFIVDADIESYNQHPSPTSCGVATSFGGKKCNSKKFNKISTLNSNNARDYQELKVQEQVQHLNMGALPRSIQVVVLDGLAGMCNAGDEVTVTGLVTHRWGMLTMEEKPELELIILCTHLTINNERRTSSSITDDDSREFSTFWQEYGSETPLLARDAVIRSICPEVYGMRNVKLAIAVILAGGVRVINGSNATRGDSHLLMVGDPGTGKSQLLRFAAKLASRSVLTTGVGTTGAGLTATAVKDNNGQWGLEAGALVLADGGACCIDEFSSINKEELTSIHEAMEQQIVHVAKAAIRCQLHTRCSVIAATNPKSKYNVDETISMNVAITSPILSRFDLVMILQDECNDIWDKAISAFILKERTRGILRLNADMDDMDEDLEAVDDEEAQIQIMARSAPQTPSTPNGASRMDTSPSYRHRQGSMYMDDETGSNSMGSMSMGMDQSFSSRSGAGQGHSGPAALLNDTWSLEKLRSYITWIKTSFQPRLSVEARTIGTAYYKRQRQADDQDAARTTTRLAESFTRLAQGHAKLMARHIVVIQDAVVAILLLESSSASWILGGNRIPTVRSFFPIDPDSEYQEMEGIILKHLGLSHLSSLPPPSTNPPTPLPPRISGDHGGIIMPSTPNNGIGSMTRREPVPSSPHHRSQPSSQSNGGFFTRPPGASSQTKAIRNVNTSTNMDVNALNDFESNAIPTDPRLPSQVPTYQAFESNTSDRNGGLRVHQTSQNLQKPLATIPLVFDDSSQATTHSSWNVRQQTIPPIRGHESGPIPSSQASIGNQEMPNTLSSFTAPESQHSEASAYSYTPSETPHVHLQYANQTEQRNNENFRPFQPPSSSPPTMSALPELVPLPPGMDSDFGVWEMRQTETTKPFQIAMNSVPLSASQMDLDEDFMM